MVAAGSCKTWFYLSQGSEAYFCIFKPYFKFHRSQAATVVLETLNHLEKFESTTDLTPERVNSFQKRLEENNLELSDREKLHLINLCPTTLVEIQGFVTKAILYSPHVNLPGEPTRCHVLEKVKISLMQLSDNTRFRYYVVLIDDSEERFSEDQFNLLLDIVQSGLLATTVKLVHANSFR